MFETLVFIGAFVGGAAYNSSREEGEGRWLAFVHALIAGCIWPLILGDMIVAHMQKDDEEPEEKVVLTD